MKLQTVISALSEDGSGETLYDYASEYGEPGYSTRGPVLLGNWWCHRHDCSYTERYEDGRRKTHGLEYHYPRLFAFLESEGCEFEWSDEWTIIDDKAYRTQADSYSWQPTAVWNDDICEYMVNGEDIDEWLEWAVNAASRCLMNDSFTDAELESAGFVERQCDYEDGWYGVNDDPAEIMRAIRDRESVDVLFKLASTEQFRVTFCVYVREGE